MLRKPTTVVVAVLLVAATVLAGSYAAGLAAPGAVAPVAAQADDVDDAENATTVTVTATGDAEADADLAVVSLAVVATGPTASGAADRVAANASQMRAALLNAGLDRSDVRTTGFRVFERRRGDDRDPRNQTVEFVAEQTFAVEAANTSRAGEIIDVALANGATAVRGVQFTLSEERQRDVRNQAIEEAVDSARSQAETLADAEGLRLTGVRSMRTIEQRFVPFEAVRETAAGGDAGTVIDPGPVTVAAQVEVTYVAADASTVDGDESDGTGE